MNETRLFRAQNLSHHHPPYWHAIQWDLARRPCRCFLPCVSHTWKGTKGHGHPTRLFSVVSRRLRPLYRIHYSASGLTMSIAITVHLFNAGRDALIIKAPVILMAVIIEYAFMKPDIKKTATLGGPVPIHLQRKRKSRGQNLHFSVVIYHVNRDCTLHGINRAELRHLEEKDIWGRLEDQEIKESGKERTMGFWALWEVANLARSSSASSSNMSVLYYEPRTGKLSTVIKCHRKAVIGLHPQTFGSEFAEAKRVGFASSDGPVVEMSELMACGHYLPATCLPD